MTFFKTEAPFDNRNFELLTYSEVDLGAFPKGSLLLS